MERNEEKDGGILSSSMIGGYFSILLALWFAAELVLFPVLENHLPYVWLVLITETFKAIAWVVPVILLMRKFSSSLEVSLNEMVKPKQTLKIALPIVLLFLLYMMLEEYLADGTVGIHWGDPIDFIGSVLVAGIAEEIVFRGFIQNALAVRMKHCQAIVITAVLFLVIHFPIWLHNGILQSIFLSGSFLNVLGISMLFSWTFLKSRTIYTPIILHMCWNFLVGFLI